MIKLRSLFMGFIVFLVALLAVSFALDASEAGSFHLEASVLGQVRDNERSEREVPVNDYFGLDFDLPKAKVSGESNLRHFRDFAREIDDFDLYQTVIHYQPNDLLLFDFGRQFLSEGFSAELIDGIRMVFSPKGYLDLTVYSGIPRTDEIGDFNKDDGLLTGMTLGLKNVKNTNAQLHAAWRKNDINQSDLSRSDDILVGANLSHQFEVKARPLVYGLIEYDVSGKVLNAGTVGLDIYPSDRISLNTEFNYFNINHRSVRSTPFEALTRGPVVSGRLASRWTIIKDRLDFVESYAFQYEEVQTDIHRNAHLLDAGFEISIDEIGMFIETAYYLSKSYGGILNGGRGSLHEQITDKIDVSLGADYSKYNKVTNVKTFAFSTDLWAGYEIIEGLKLSGGVEFNRNILFDNDVRGSFKIDYSFHHAI